MSKIALISVSNKDGIIDFAKNLISLDYKIISTGGTYQLLKENNIDAVEEFSLEEKSIKKSLRSTASMKSILW